jgi:death-on-curing protein
MVNYYALMRVSLPGKNIMLEPIIFLTLAEVVVIHLDQIERYGGLGGVQNMALLESALAMPEA